MIKNLRNDKEFKGLMMTLQDEENTYEIFYPVSELAELYEDSYDCPEYTRKGLEDKFTKFSEDEVCDFFQDFLFEEFGYMRTRRSKLVSKYSELKEMDALHYEWLTYNVDYFPVFR